MTTPHLIAAGAVLAVAGFAAGRVSKHVPPPAAVETREVVKYQDRVEYRDRVVTVQGKDRVVHKVVRVVVAADGSKQVTATTDDSTAERQATSSASEAARTTALAQVRTVEVRVAQRPSWTVSAMAGTAPSDLASRFWAASVAHRLFGPVSGGAVVVRDGAWRAGAVLGVSW